MSRCIFGEDQATIIVKWSKTLQNRKNIKAIYLPVLGSSPLCPVASLRAMYRQYPADRNQSLFLIPRANTRLIPLADSVARKHLKVRLQIVPHLTFHAFQRAGCTWAFHKGVPIHQIMAQGTWSSVYGGTFLVNFPFHPCKPKPFVNICTYNSTPPYFLLGFSFLH